HITTHHMTQVLNRATSALCTSNARRFDLRSQPTLPRDMTARGTDLSIAIVGAGLAGLCLAQSLRREGLDIHIFERDPSPHVRRQGYRITLDEHGASALKKCLPPESFEAVLATASSDTTVGYFRFTNRDLGEIFKLTFKPDRQSGRSILGQVDRSTLRTIMLAGLEDCTHYDKAAVHIVQAPDGVTIHFADGSS